MNEEIDPARLQSLRERLRKARIQGDERELAEKSRALESAVYEALRDSDRLSVCPTCGRRGP